MARVIMSGWFSKCSECGGNAHPDDTAHIRGGPNDGYTEGSSLSDNNGCGVVFDEPPVIEGMGR
jgi:hypothetical protein